MNSIKTQIYLLLSTNLRYIIVKFYSYQLVKLGEVLRRLREAGLKVNAAKSFFCTHEIEYLSYTLTRGGIKPQPKQVQAILALNPPHNVKAIIIE